MRVLLVAVSALSLGLGLAVAAIPANASTVATTLPGRAETAPLDTTPRSNVNSGDGGSGNLGIMGGNANASSASSIWGDASVRQPLYMFLSLIGSAAVGALLVWASRPRPANASR